VMSEALAGDERSKLFTKFPRFPKPD